MTGIFTYLKGLHFCACVREAMDPDRDILTKPLLKVGSLKVKEKLIKSKSTLISDISPYEKYTLGFFLEIPTNKIKATLSSIQKKCSMVV